MTNIEMGQLKKTLPNKKMGHLKWFGGSMNNQNLIIELAWYKIRMNKKEIIVLHWIIQVVGVKSIILFLNTT